MSTKQYYLYRAKFIKPSQLPLLGENLSPSEFFLKSLNERPAHTMKSGIEWHLGNLFLFDDNKSGSFAVGKTTRTTVEKFDKDSGNFTDQLESSAPYTTVVFDANIGLIGIAKKPKLASNSNSIARRIQDLLSASSTVVNAGVEVIVSIIPDPDDFLDKLASSYAIKRFKATFTGPNPIDADELFQRPLAVYAQAMEASSGNLEVVGDSLNETTARQVAKSTAATGNSASARIIDSYGNKAQTIKMKGDAVSITVSEDATTTEVLEKMQSAYMRVRG